MKTLKCCKRCLNKVKSPAPPGGFLYLCADVVCPCHATLLATTPHGEDWRIWFERKQSVREQNSFMNYGDDGCPNEVDWEEIQSFVEKIEKKAYERGKSDEHIRIVKIIKEFALPSDVVTLEGALRLISSIKSNTV